MEKLNIYDNINISYSAITNTLNSNEISGVTFNGLLNSSFVGSGQSIINNTIFSYQSGLTDYIQTQINDKINTQPKLLNFSSNSYSGNNKILTGLTNVTIENTPQSGNYKLIQSIKKLNLSQVTVVTSGDGTYNISNLNPQNFNESYPNRAQSILLIPQCVIRLNGIVGGEDGRIITVINGGKFIVIFENLNNSSDLENQFKFKNNKFFILNPNNSITLIYNSDIQKWVYNGLLDNYGLDYYEEFNRNYSGILPTLGVNASTGYDNTTFPFATKYFSLYGNPSGVTTEGSSIYFNGDGQVCLLRGKGTNNNNRDGRVRLGMPFGEQTKFQKSGTSLVLLSKFRMNPNSPDINLDNWSIIFGLNNSNLDSTYNTLTSNNEQPPNLNGGVFWNLSAYPQPEYPLYYVQTTGNTTTFNGSDFPSVVDLKGGEYEFGIYYLPKSGNTDGSATFFWRKDDIGEPTSIQPPIPVTSTDIKGSPSITFYGNTLYSGNTDINNISSLFINYMGYKVNKNI